MLQHWAGCTGNVCLLRRVAPAGNAGCENGNIHKYKIVIAMVCFSRYVLDCLDWNCEACYALAEVVLFACCINAVRLLIVFLNDRDSVKYHFAHC